MSQVLQFGNLFGCVIAGCIGCNEFLLAMSDTWAGSHHSHMLAWRLGESPQCLRHRQIRTRRLAAVDEPGFRSPVVVNGRGTRHFLFLKRR